MVVRCNCYPRGMTDLNRALDDVISTLLRLRGVLDPSEVASGLGMSVSEALALRHLDEQSLSQSELGERLGLEKSTVSRLVDGLIAEGWATKTRCPDNGRVRDVTITPAGARAAERVARSMRDRHARMFEQLTEKEHQALLIALPALARVLDASEQPEPPR